MEKNNNNLVPLNDSGQVPSYKNKKNIIIIFIIILIVLTISTISIMGFLLLKNPYIKIASAFNNTITKNSEYLNNKTNYKEYLNFFEKNDYNLNIASKFLFFNTNFDIAAKNDTKRFKFDLQNKNIFDIYTDKDSILLSSNQENNTIYQVDYKDFNKDFNKYSQYNLAIENLNKNLNKIKAIFTKNILKSFKSFKYEKIKTLDENFDNNQLKLNGYRFFITYDDINKLIQNSFDNLIKNESLLTDISKAFNFYEEALEINKQDLKDLILEYKDFFEEFASFFENVNFTLDIYIKEDYIYKCSLNAISNNINIATLDFFAKGNFYPLQDMEINFKLFDLDDLIFNFKSISNIEKGNFSHNTYINILDEKLNILSIKFDENTNYLNINYLDDMINLDIIFKNIKPKEKLDITLDISFFNSKIMSNEISFSKQNDEIQKPTGNIQKINDKQFTDFLSKTILKTIFSFGISFINNMEDFYENF